MIETRNRDRTLMKGRIKIELFDEAGNLKEMYEKDNTFMAVGDAHVADQLDVSPDEAVMGFMSVGTGTTAFTTASTTLNSEIDRNSLNASYPDQTLGSDDNDIVYKANWAAGDATDALTEAGIFNSSVTDQGTMLAASTFSVINKGASDTLTITWTVTVGAS